MKINQMACLVLAMFSGASMAFAQAPDPKATGPKLSVEDCFANAQKLESQNQLKEAEEFYSLVVTNIEKEKVQNLPALFKAYNGLATLDMKQQNLQFAEDNYRRALSTAVKLYGAGSADLIKPLMNSARVSYQRKNYSNAAQHLNQALKLSERKAGAEDAETVVIREKLAETYERCGNYKDSEALIKQSLALREKSGDRNSKQLVALLNCYSDVLRKTDRNTEAEHVEYQVDQIHAGKSPAPLPFVGIAPTGSSAATATATDAAGKTSSATTEPVPAKP